MLNYKPDHSIDNGVLSMHGTVMKLLIGLTGFWVPGWRNTKPKVKGIVKKGYEPVREVFQKTYDNGTDSRS